MFLASLRRRLPQFTLRLMACTLAVGAARAQTWQTGTDSNWSTSANWNSSTPANDGTAAIVFSNSGSTTSAVDAAWSIDSLTFDSGAQSYTISGSTLSIGAGGINSRASNTETISAPVSFGSTTSIDVVSGGTLTLSGALTGTVSLTKTGAGTLALQGGSTYSGTLNLDAGTLTFPAAGRSTNSMLAHATLNLNGGTFSNAAFNPSIGAIGGSGNFVVARSGTAVPFSIGGNNASTTFSGVMSGPGTVTKQGTGTWTLSGANTYTGTTTVSAGTLAVDGSLASASTVTVASGGTLGGSGTIGGATTVQSGGTLAPGNSPGLLTFSGNLTLNSGSASLFQIDGNSRGTTYDAVDVAGITTFGGTLSLAFGSTIDGGTTLDLFGGTGSLTGDFDTITASGSYSGTFTSNSGLWSLVSGAQTLSFDASTGDLSFTGSAVPEPSTYAALAGLAALGFAFLRRRTA